MSAKRSPAGAIPRRRMAPLVGFACLFSGAALAQPSLEELQSLKSGSVGAEAQTTEFSEIRAETQKAAALTVGAQGGLKSRNLAIRRILTARAVELNTLFNFSRLLIDGRVVRSARDPARKASFREGR